MIGEFLSELVEFRRIGVFLLKLVNFGRIGGFYCYSVGLKFCLESPLVWRPS